MTNIRTILIDRTADRIARIKGDQVPVVPVESAPMPDVEPVKATGAAGWVGAEAAGLVP